MERKIGEIFEYDGNKLRVEACENSNCSNCYFEELCPNINLDIVGNCESTDRQDKSNVKFIAIEKESELNLCEILKNCPKGWEFYSSVFMARCSFLESHHQTSSMQTKKMTRRLWKSMWRSLIIP